jgi:hypothetical protein
MDRAIPEKINVRIRQEEYMGDTGSWICCFDPGGNRFLVNPLRLRMIYKGGLAPLFSLAGDLENEPLKTLG